MPMDRNVQERLVGAIVLVIIAVLVIPEFLSGPRQRESITQGLELPAEGESELQTVTIRMDQSADVPQAATGQGAVASTTVAVEDKKSVQQQAAIEAKQAATATRPAKKADVVPGSGADWAVQVGSFSERDNALRLANTLKQQGYAATVSQHKSRGRTLHRVRIGPMRTRAEADTMAARLNREGQQAAVVSLP